MTGIIFSGVVFLILLAILLWQDKQIKDLEKQNKDLEKQIKDLEKQIVLSLQADTLLRAMNFLTHKQLDKLAEQIHYEWTEEDTTLPQDELSREVDELLKLYDEDEKN